MKKNLKIVFSLATIITVVFLFINIYSLKADTYKAAKGKYVEINGESVFQCPHSYGTTDCIYKVNDPEIK